MFKLKDAPFYVLPRPLQLPQRWKLQIPVPFITKACPRDFFLSAIMLNASVDALHTHEGAKSSTTNPLKVAIIIEDLCRHRAAAAANATFCHAYWTSTAVISTSEPQP